jgi:two-component system chemotaxis response regulator CheV
MQNVNQTNILLESGTNELEIMEFTIEDELFGINVAKVKEIMMASPVKPMQKAHPVIEGIYKPRDQVITVIDLSKYLNLSPSTHPEKDIFIITNFNQQDFAFHVHTVVGIDRISWTKMQKPDQIIYGGEEGVATAIAEYQNRLITILDFEKIVTEISPPTGIQYSDLERLGHRNRNDKPILVAEDSMMLSKMIIESLHRAGYVNTVKVNNGQEAWDYLEEVKASGDEIERHVACIVSDIEMPQMDGHRFTKLVKDDPQLKKLPLILFSSLINDEMKKKGQQLGADEQLSKPEIANLVLLIDKLTAARDEEVIEGAKEGALIP